MSDKYTHLRDMIMETENGVAKTVTNTKQHVAEAVAHLKDRGVEKACELSRDVDKSAHQNPWPFIGGTAIISLLFGYILGRNK